MTPAALVLGLALTPGQTHAANYFMDRVNDFADMFRFRVGVPENGKAGGVKARATVFAQAGFVHYDGWYTGINKRALGTTQEERTEGGVSLLYGSKHTTIPQAGNIHLEGDTPWAALEDRHILLNMPYWDDGRGDLLSVGTEVATPFFALDVGVNTTEVLDFVAGIFTIDPFQDDLVGRSFDSVDPRPWRTLPTTEPDLSWAASRKQAELDAANAAIQKELMEDAGQLGEEAREPGETPPVEDLTRVTETEEIVGDKPLTDKALDQVEQHAEEVVLPPAEAPDTEEPEPAEAAPVAPESEQEAEDSEQEDKKSEHEADESEHNEAAETEESEHEETNEAEE